MVRRVQMPARRKPVGQIAIELKFATPAQVRKALRIQRREDAEGLPHRLLGIILASEGIISTSDMIQILKYYQNEKKRKLLETIQKAHTPDLGESQQPIF